MGQGSQLAANVREGISPLVDLVYPPRCPLCGTALAAQGGLCVDCWGELEVPGEPACRTCQTPMASAKNAVTTQCSGCQNEPPRHSGIIAATIYDDAARKLILTLKHGGKIALAPLLARLIAARLPIAETQPLLVPVPLHRWRLWRRGFNQAALLAGELAKLRKGELFVDGLIRKKRTPSLGGLGSEARARALDGAIAVRGGAKGRLAGRDVILVDDVLTSGATSNACVTALLEGGAASVRIACFARVVHAVREEEFTMAKDQKNETPEAVKTPGAT
jgi:ComF family protein